MSNLPSILSAVAAGLAAALAGLTLYATGRRGTRKWLRESLVEHYVEILTSSFNSAGDRGFKARQNGEINELNVISERARRAYRDGTAVLTRLRILAPREVGEVAERLHRFDHSVSSAVLGPGPLPSEDAWHEMRGAQRAAREALLVEIRKSLGLQDAARIGRFPKEVDDDVFS
jgi:hypothetical protein